MELNELKAYQKGLLEGASAQRGSTAANVFAYIIDHGELIPEEKCLQMLSDFLKDKHFNKIDIQKNNKEMQIDTKPVCLTCKAEGPIDKFGNCFKCVRALSD